MNKNWDELDASAIAKQLLGKYGKEFDMMRAHIDKKLSLIEAKITNSWYIDIWLDARLLIDKAQNDTTRI